MKLLKAFLKDQIPDFAAYLGITVLILYFYDLKYHKFHDILYPIILAVFVVVSITIYKGIRYFRFYHALKNNDFSKLKLQGTTNQEKQIIESMESLCRRYEEETSKLVNDRNETYAFIAQMAHELKIPVSVIQLVIESSDTSDILTPDKKKILTESDKLNEKLSQLISYLRLGQFDKDYLIERVNLIDEVRKAINRKKDYFILNKSYPRFDTKQDAVFVLTDQKWNAMLLDQIISNAIKYSSIKGEGYIQFDIGQTDLRVQLKITDYGIGIPDYDMDRIFEPFFTGENGRQVAGSSGIGLYLCRNIADKLGHTISVTSIRGEKTEVTIEYLTKP
jgi:signal transduction histidine kinase